MSVHCSTNGYSCICCVKVRNMVNAAARSDLKCLRGVSTMTFDYVNSYDGCLCPTCGIKIHVTEDPFNPACLSMNRLDNSKPHDNDPLQTVGTCLQCNLWQCDLSLVDFLQVVDSAASFSFTNDDNTTTISLPSHYRNRRLFGVDIIGQKKGRCKQIGVSFDYTLEQLQRQYEIVQKGRCYACGLLLGVDISFDRTDSSSGYNYENVTLMHYNCNAGKSVWPLSVLHATAVRSVAYRAGLAASTKKAND